MALVGFASNDQAQGETEMRIHKDRSWEPQEERFLVPGASCDTDRRSTVDDLRLSQPYRVVPTLPAVAGVPELEIAVLFDRFLDVVREATQRFGGLFPYNQLRTAIQRALADSAATVVVLDAHGHAVVSFDVECLDGQLHRARGPAGKVCTWAVTVEALERAASAPWEYVTNPFRLDFAWFRDHEGSTRVTGVARSTKP